MEQLPTTDEGGEIDIPDTGDMSDYEETEVSVFSYKFAKCEDIKRIFSKRIQESK